MTLNTNRPCVRPQNRLDPDDGMGWNASAPGPCREPGFLGYLSRRRLVVAVVSTLVASGIAASAFNLSGLFNESRLYFFGMTCVCFCVSTSGPCGSVRKIFTSPS